MGLVSLLLLASAAVVEAAVPEQIHLALTEDAGCMRVTWVTMVVDDAGGSVSYGASVDGPELGAVVPGSSYAYGGDNFTGTLHSAVLVGLRDGVRYEYAVSSASGETSPALSFRYRREAAALSLLAYGDMGVRNSAGTVARADALAATEAYDLFLNVGDTSYANDVGPYGNNSWVFDEHFRNIQGHVSRMPFMTAPGNHEAQYDYRPYVHRLPMPRVPNASASLAPFYYSFDYGPAHFLAYSSEAEHPLGVGGEQRAFVERDLAAANANRRRRPWIIAFTHHPMYCSDLFTELTRCRAEAYNFRKDLEAVFKKSRFRRERNARSISREESKTENRIDPRDRYHLDLHISGHNHQYERSIGVFGCDEKGAEDCDLSNATTNHPLPIYIVNGAGGDTEGIDPSWVPERLAPFRAFHGRGLRTGLATADLNLTHLVWKFHYTGRGAWPRSQPFNTGTIQDDVVVDELVLARDPAAPAPPAWGLEV